MDHLQKLVGQVRRYFFAVLVLENLVLAGAWWALQHYIPGQPVISGGALAVLAAVLITIIALTGTKLVLEPTTALWQGILHITPGFHGVIPPKIESLRVGRELVAALTAQVYEFASKAEHLPNGSEALGNIQSDTILKGLPLPIIALDKNRTIILINEATAQYLGVPSEDILGKNFYSVFNLSFSSDTTLDQWLGEVSRTKALADTSWDRVRLKVGEAARQFDLSAHYSKDNPSGIEVTLALFDHTAKYNEDDQGIGFVALSVHELRTPLTLLRGYIEVFEDEMQGKLTPELESFMQKMNAAAQQLTAFVSNILNVARIENDQLVLSLHEENWATVLQGAVENMELRARVRGIELECGIADNLPTVGVDRVSIFEVLNNLVDNAIKYSGTSKLISIRAELTKDGLVETTIQDRGVGIPESVMPNLFNKFYRNFHNRAQVGGTGLGLYLCKALIAAHGGNIWVRSREGEGTTFGFTLIPYAKLADDQKNGDNSEIIRGAHGWIKNHSLYRR